MPTVYFNDKLRRNINQALFTRIYGVNPLSSGDAERNQYGLRTGLYQKSPSSTQDTRVYGVVKLMKGTVPTDFSELTSTTSRDSDILVTWTTSTIGWNFTDPVTNFDGLAVVSSPYAVATASGIATWFWWYLATPANPVYPATENYIVIQLAGTVGTSGADLNIPDTTIIAGANYRFENLKFDVPTEYTY
jgi:hypothetical protein